MEIKIARLLSYLFHPLLLPTYTYLLLLHHDSLTSYYIPLKMKWTVIGFVFLLSAVLPVMINYVFLRRGLIRSFMLENRKERLLPFLITAACIYMTAYMAENLQLPLVLYLFSLGASMLALMALFMTLYVKVSIHCIGIGGMTGTFLGLAIRWQLDSLWLVMLLFLVSGLVAYSRLRLQAHKPPEVYSGYVTGFGVMLLLFLLV